MEAIDGTSHQAATLAVPPPSLLVVVIDTSPLSWITLSSNLTLSSVLKTLLIYINAHLAVNHENRVAILASHVDRVTWLHPTSEGESSSQLNGHTSNGISTRNKNKYQPFAVVREHLIRNLDNLLSNTESSESAMSSPPTLSGALSIALSYANVQVMSSAPSGVDAGAGQNGIPGAANLDAHTAASRGAATGQQLVSRVLTISVSQADLSGQYIGLMNSVFAAQRLQIPIDILRIGERTAFLQQASDATGGVFMNYTPPAMADDNSAAAGLLQTLMMAYLPDTTARRALVMAGSAEVDFRAACFCHGKIVDLGGVCSICLSIFCLPLETTVCPTCQSPLRIPNSVTTKPIVVARKKKKKRKVGGDGGTPNASAIGTPA